MDHQYYSTTSHDTPLSYAYDENAGPPASPTQLPLGLFSYDHRPQPQQYFDRQFLSATSSPSDSLQEPYRFSPHLSMSEHHSLPWNGTVHNSTSFNPQLRNREDYNFNPSATYTTTSKSDDTFGRSMGFDGVPRNWEHYNPHLLQETPISSFHSSEYMIEDNKPNFDERQSNDRMETIFDSPEASHNYPPLCINRSSLREDDFAGSPSMQRNYSGQDGLSFHHSTPSRMPSCEMSEEGNGNASREMSIMEPDDLGADEPYAKLIYRALMSAPNHSMVLQEIYQWFRENTSKGSSDSKGWMNSIRHNLSMNAAFKKTERKHSTDDTKKSTEWVLEGFAIKGGVQSTTRYRKGTSSKKHPRCETLAPSRQRSGQKGGMSTSNTTRLRRTNDVRHRTSSHSIPRLDTASIGLGSSAMRRFGHLDLDERQRSPLTPPLGEGPSGPYYGFAKMEGPSTGFEMGFEDLYGLEHVQGVCVDDGPVFAAPGGQLHHQIEMGEYQGFSVGISGEQRF